MTLKQISSIEDLQNYGTIEEIRLEISKIIYPLICNSKNYDDLYEVLIKLKSNWVDYIDGPFLNERERYIFILNNTEGKTRNGLLGIKDEYYHNKKLAKDWFQKIAKLIHPDKGGDDNAFLMLNNIYNIMIEEDD